jgi:hypothetical protein
MEVTYEQSANFNKVRSRCWLFGRADFVSIGTTSWALHVDDKHNPYPNIDNLALPSCLSAP